ncbi:MAG: XRE family transcriptional regulator [Hyphomicrobiales bacterium]|nr:MAG: XRE family transcriptional regulator [Hyphomicrobiales bacterium]
MIDYRQIRAARALLNWSQADLARASGMATSSIKNIENESTSSRKETLTQIRDTFDQNGIEFTPGSGVRLKNDIVAVHDGKRATTALHDSIYTHVQGSADREVCIIGMDETFSVESDGLLPIVNHIDRLRRAGVSERILICEGDTRFLNSPDSYRWLPRNYFNRNAPIYIYGDRVAIHSGSLRRRTVIIESRPLAQHLKRIFCLLWDEIAFAPCAMHEERRAARR